jgi:hypothetical protein
MTLVGGLTRAVGSNLEEGATDEGHEPDQAAVYRLARGVFEATWTDRMGRRWPELAGDVAALCDLAIALGRGRGASGHVDARPGV